MQCFVSFCGICKPLDIGWVSLISSTERVSGITILGNRIGKLESFGSNKMYSCWPLETCLWKPCDWVLYLGGLSFLVKNKVLVNVEIFNRYLLLSLAVLFHALPNLYKSYKLVFPFFCPSMLWRCWLGVRKSIRPVNFWVMRCWCGYLSGARCRLFAYGPADATASQNPIISCLI